MSSGYIPKERLTAYERWEVAAFDEAEQISQSMREAEAKAEVDEPAGGEPAPAVAPEPALSAEELAAIREQAFAEGRAAGFEAGLVAGKADGYASGAALINAESELVASVAKNFALALENSEATLADNLLALALDIAGQVLRTSLSVKPELLLPVVREAIGVLTNPHGHPCLVLNPDDAALIRDQLGEQFLHTGWRIVEDAAVARGGCKVENSGAEIDASLATRWRRVVEALGRKSDWLDPS